MQPIPSNLPIQLSSFVGRERDIAEVTRLLFASRLLTLTGTGGCGKTRLALQVASDLLDADDAANRLADGIWLVELASLFDPTLVPQTLAAVLNVPEVPGRAMLDVLSDYLHTRKMLILLDNCEHLIAACAQLADRLLRTCPALRILATSREALGVVGETVWHVSSLSVPDPPRLLAEKVERAAVLAQFEATRLFVDRTAAALPGFAVTNQNALAVAQVCARLDGIPLAIELAAARMRALSVEQIAARLDDRFNLLKNGSRTALPRHQTLRAAIDWSYDLLSEKERILFRWLGVFAGGWTLEAAEGVCQDDAATTSTGSGQALHSSDVLDLLSRLVIRSLVVVEERSGHTRYRILDTLRQYAREKLNEAGEREVAAVRDRHLAFFLKLAEEAEPELQGSQQLSWFDRLDEEHDNLRAALAWSLERGESDSGLRIAGHLWMFWEIHGHLAEGRRWLDHVLSKTQGERTAARAKALNSAGTLANDQGDYALARSFYESALAIRQELGDKPRVAASLNNLGNVALNQGDYATARARYESALAIRRELGDKEGSIVPIFNLGMVAAREGTYESARGFYEESRAMFAELGDQEGVADALGALGGIALRQNDLKTARLQYEESLAIYRELRDKRGIARTMHNLGNLARSAGDHALARALVVDSLKMREEFGDKRGIAECLERLAGLAAAQSDSERAARWFGAAEALRQAIGAPLPPSERAEYDRDVAAARAQLDPARFAAAWTLGRAKPLEQIIEEGLSGEPDVKSERRALSPAAQPASREQLRILGFGHARVFRGDQPLTSSDWTYAKSRELLFYLLCQPPRTKEQIGLALWPDWSTAQLRNNFRVILYHLRRALGRPDWILFEEDRYAFNRSLGSWFDVQAFKSHLGAAQDALRQSSPDRAAAARYLQQAVTLYQGDFLDDLTEGDWHLIEREELRRMYLEALLTLGQALFAEGNYAEATQAYRLVIAKDSYLELAHRELMRCYGRQGERGQAIRHYQAFVEMMRGELGTLPASETTALYERLSRGEEV